MKGIQCGMEKENTHCFKKHLNCFNMGEILNLIYIASYS